MSAKLRAIRPNLRQIQVDSDGNVWAFDIEADHVGHSVGTIEFRSDKWWALPADAKSIGGFQSPGQALIHLLLAVNITAINNPIEGLKEKLMKEAREITRGDKEWVN